MIDAAARTRSPAQLRQAAHGLAAAWSCPLALPDGSDAPREWVEALAPALPATRTCALLEHLFGVLPLATARLSSASLLDTLASGRIAGGLALFATAPSMASFAPPLRITAAKATTSAPDVLELHGELPIAQPRAAGWLALARDEESGTRLVWLAAEELGPISPREARAGWRTVDGARVAPGCSSEPFVPEHDGELLDVVERHRLLWAHAALRYATAELLSLRRAARLTTRGSTTLRAWQPLSLALGELEIELEMASLAVRAHLERFDSPAGDRGRLAATTGAARTLAALERTAAELAARYGLTCEGPLSDPAEAAALRASGGGVAALEAALAVALGIDTTTAAEVRA